MATRQSRFLLGSIDPTITFSGTGLEKKEVSIPKPQSPHRLEKIYLSPFVTAPALGTDRHIHLSSPEASPRSKKKSQKPFFWTKKKEPRMALFSRLSPQLFLI